MGHQTISGPKPHLPGPCCHEVRELRIRTGTSSGCYVTRRSLVLHSRDAFPWRVVRVPGGSTFSGDASKTSQVRGGCMGKDEGQQGGGGSEQPEGFQRAMPGRVAGLTSKPQMPGEQSRMTKGRPTQARAPPSQAPPLALASLGFPPALLSSSSGLMTSIPSEPTQPAPGAPTPAATSTIQNPETFRELPLGPGEAPRCRICTTPPRLATPGPRHLSVLTHHTPALHRAFARAAPSEPSPSRGAGQALSSSARRVPPPQLQDLIPNT